MLSLLRIAWFIVIEGLMIAAFSSGERMLLPDWFMLGVIFFIAVLIVTDIVTLYRARRTARTDPKETA